MSRYFCVIAIFLGLMGCEKKTVSFSAIQRARKTGIMVTPSAEGPTAVFETTARYTLLTGTVTANSLPSLNVEVSLRLGDALVQGKSQPVHFNFKEGGPIKTAGAPNAATWVASRKDTDRAPPYFEVVVTGPISNFDSKKAPCGSEVPVEFSTEWSATLVKSEWKLEKAASGTLTSTLDALVRCSDSKKNIPPETN